MAPLSKIEKYGQTSSALLTQLSGFKSLRTSFDAVIQYKETRRAWVGATEPFAPISEKIRALDTFSLRASSVGKYIIQMPVTKNFARAALVHGYYAIQVGAEAVFNLQDYFISGSRDPLERFQHARNLKRKGVGVIELNPKALTSEQEEQILSITAQWIEAKQKEGPSLQFLNLTDPLALKDQRRLFVAQATGNSEILGFISAIPCGDGKSYFFADYFRSPKSKVGTIELLFTESMRLLHHAGIKEVRLGLCPFVKLFEPVGAVSPWIKPLMKGALKWLKTPYNAQGIYTFKSKFLPTRWEPMYLVSSKPIGWSTLAQVSESQLGVGPIKGWFNCVMRDLGKGLLQSFKQLNRTQENLPTSIFAWAKASPMTLGLVTGCLALHAFRLNFSLYQKIYEQSGYVPQSITPQGLVLGPFFHNNFYHLAGDLSTLLLIGSITEVLLGRGIFALVTALGLWASNPVTHLLVSTFLTSLSPESYTHFLAENDYGSSNAIYALVGLLSAHSRNPGMIFLPFAMNGLFLCLSKQSWLSLHHLVGLALGYGVGAWYSRRLASRKAA